MFATVKERNHMRPLILMFLLCSVLHSPKLNAKSLIKVVEQCGSKRTQPFDNYLFKQKKWGDKQFINKRFGWQKETALMLATYNSNYLLVEKIIENGGSILITNKKGDSAMHIGLKTVNSSFGGATKYYKRALNVARLLMDQYETMNEMPETYKSSVEALIAKMPAEIKRQLSHAGHKRDSGKSEKKPSQKSSSNSKKTKRNHEDHDELLLMDDHSCSGLSCCDGSSCEACDDCGSCGSCDSCEDCGGCGDCGTCNGCGDCGSCGGGGSCGSCDFSS